MFQTFPLRPDEEAQSSSKPISLIPSSFAGLIIGPPGSGKSRLIADMLYNTKALYKRFDLVLFLVPYEEAFDLNLPPERVNNSLSVDWISGQIEKEKNSRPVDNCLLIIDDLVSSINKAHMNPQIIDLFFNRRKMFGCVETSIICTTQKFTLFPAKFRSSLQWLILFQVPPEDLKLVVKQHVFNSPAHLPLVLSNHWKKLYNFIFIKLDRFGIFLNFDRQI